MIDALGRDVDYLRLSLTDRCSLRCIYCMPEEGVPPRPRGEMLPLEELFRLAWLMTEHAGIRRIRLTGGEPLERRGAVEITRWLSSLGLRELTMTTNGLALPEYAGPLAGAGLDRVNVSLDSLDDARLARITGRDVTRGMVEEAIDAARQAGLGPVRVNCVVLGGLNDDELPDFLEWGMDLGVMVRFIEHMPSARASGEPVRAAEILGKVSVLGEPVPLETAPGSTHRLWGIRGTCMEFGLIAPFSDDMCRVCSRVRLTSSGILLTCLAEGEGTDLGAMVREGADEASIVNAVRKAVYAKPERMGECGRVEMWRIGG
jgi:cyclic pyranopterin phosphate synthase